MNLLRATLTVGGLTLISRVLGFVRDILMARYLGAGPVADAFVVAFRFPNLFRRFFAEGAFNSAFVPLYSKSLEGEGDAAARKFASEAMSGLIFVLLILTGIALVFMPWLMLLLAGGFNIPDGDQPDFALGEALARLVAGETTEKYDLAVELTRIAFPYLTFMSLVALLSGVLNSVRKFTLAALAPSLLNLVLILTLLFAVPYFPTPGHALVWGVSFAGLLQFLTLCWGAHRSGLMPHLVRPRFTPGMRRLVYLGIPGLIAGGITQINIVIGSMIASFQEGAAAMLFYADRVYQLPMGLIGVAMGVVLLPDLSRRLRAGDEAGALHAQNRALELSMFLTLPAAVALAVAPLELVSILFQRGAFTSDVSAGTARALAAFAWGLPAFVLIKVFQPGFFAREDTATPMWFAGVNTVVNVAGSLLLFEWIGFIGIAIATSAAAWVNAALLIGRLAHLGQLKLDARVTTRLPRIALAALAMGASVWLATHFGAHFFVPETLVGFIAIGLLVGLGMAVYFGFVLAFGGASLGELLSSLFRSPKAGDANAKTAD